MRNNRSSWTAIVAAARRAIKSEKPAAERICYDPLARKFIGWIPYLFIKTIVVFQERRKAPLPKYILYRYRFFDDYIQKCLASGITQLVNLGAGWDSRAYRGELLERKVRTFEVDHPATQAEKIRKVKNSSLKSPHMSSTFRSTFSAGLWMQFLPTASTGRKELFFFWKG